MNEKLFDVFKLNFSAVTLPLLSLTIDTLRRCPLGQKGSAGTGKFIPGWTWISLVTQATLKNVIPTPLGYAGNAAQQDFFSPGNDVRLS